MPSICIDNVVAVRHGMGGQHGVLGVHDFVQHFERAIACCVCCTSCCFVPCITISLRQCYGAVVSYGPWLLQGYSWAVVVLLHTQHCRPPGTMVDEVIWTAAVYSYSGSRTRTSFFVTPSLTLLCSFICNTK